MGIWMSSWRRPWPRGWRDAAGGQRAGKVTEIGGKAGAGPSGLCPPCRDHAREALSYAMEICVKSCDQLCAGLKP